MRFQVSPREERVIQRAGAMPGVARADSGNQLSRRAWRASWATLAGSGSNLTRGSGLLCTVFLPTGSDVS